MRAMIGGTGAGLLAMALLAGCAGSGGIATPVVATVRQAPAVMQARAESLCAEYDRQPVFAGWAMRSVFGKRGGYLQYTLWRCEPVD